MFQGSATPRVGASVRFKWRGPVITVILHGRDKETGEDVCCVEWIDALGRRHLDVRRAAELEEIAEVA